MIRIMIVEDDLLTRIGIASLIKGDHANFEVVAEADNGKTALDIALREDPDIIITDVKMPLMNGIELIRAAKREGLAARFVILSSYNDFEYVREGVLLGAEDYLLKLELERDNLISLLIRISAKIETQRGAALLPQDELTLRETLRDEHSKSCCVYNIVTGRLADRDLIKSTLDGCGLSIGESNLVCILAQKEFDAALPPDDAFTATQTLKTLIGVLQNYGEGYGCIVDSNLFCLIASLREPKEAPLTKVRKIRDDLASYMQNTLDVKLRICIGEPVGSYQQLSASFSENCVFENNHYFLAGDCGNGNDGVNYNFAAELSLLETVLHNGNVDDIGQAFDALLESIRRYASVPPKMFHSVCYILIHFTDQFYKSNPFIDSAWNRSQVLLKLNNSCRKPSDYQDYILHLKDILMTDIQAAKNYHSAVIRAKQFIKQNYSRDLSLDEVAASINLAPSYFSRLFSHITGVSFVNYLTDIRIQRAKELLQSTGDKIKNISENVGYSNIYYFSHVFKSKTGLTPVEYRKQKQKADAPL